MLFISAICSGVRWVLRAKGRAQKSYCPSFRQRTNRSNAENRCTRLREARKACWLRDTLHREWNGITNNYASCLTICTLAYFLMPMTSKIGESSAGWLYWESTNCSSVVSWYSTSPSSESAWISDNPLLKFLHACTHLLRRYPLLTGDPAVSSAPQPPHWECGRRRSGTHMPAACRSFGAIQAVELEKVKRSSQKGRCSGTPWSCRVTPQRKDQR